MVIAVTAKYGKQLDARIIDLDYASDAERKLADIYEVGGTTPTVIIVAQGKVYDSVVGATADNEALIKNDLKKIMGF